MAGAVAKRFCQLTITSAVTLRAINKNQLNQIFDIYFEESPDLCHSIGACALARLSWQQAFAATPQANNAVIQPAATARGKKLAESPQRLANIQPDHYKRESKRRRRHVDIDMPQRYASDFSGDDEHYDVLKKLQGLVFTTGSVQSSPTRNVPAPWQDTPRMLTTN